MRRAILPGLILLAGFILGGAPALRSAYGDYCYTCMMAGSNPWTTPLNSSNNGLESFGLNNNGYINNGGLVSSPLFSSGPYNSSLYNINWGAYGLNPYTLNANPLNANILQNYQPLQLYNPFLNQFGNLAYSNYRQPAPWAGLGINPQYFSGSGEMSVGKPNLYIQGADGQSIEVKVKLSAKSNWLASIPAYENSGWKGKIDHNGVAIQGERYPYLFYDFRTEIAPLQSEAGFCTDKKHLIFKMVEVLREMKFKDIEMIDFVKYWSVKIPPAQNYCVFPQENAQLKEVATLEVTPPPSQITRVSFAIILNNGQGSPYPKFNQPPSKSWSPTLAEPLPNGGPILREWGVAFLVIPK